jgi:hypothetical protein
MPLDISDAEDATLEAAARVKVWSKEFLANWFKPLTDTMLAALWVSLTPEQHQVMQAQNPEGYNQLKLLVEKGK